MHANRFKKKILTFKHCSSTSFWGGGLKFKVIGMNMFILKLFTVALKCVVSWIMFTVSAGLYCVTTKHCGRGGQLCCSSLGALT